MPTQPTNQPLEQISVEELAALLVDRPDALQLIDVREPQELALAKVEGFTNLPLSEYEQWSSRIQEQFDPHAPTIVMCHHGMRSAQMCQWLISQGFTQVKNLAGGIDAYSSLVDSSVPRY